MLQTVTVFHDAADRSLAALLCASQCLVFQGRDTTGLITRTGVLADGLAVREEVFLEVVDHRYRLVEEIFRATAVHQDGLCTEHLRYLGQYAGAALGYQPVGEFANERVGSDTAETVRATTFQTDAQFRYGYLCALVLTGDGIELAENLHTSLHLVIYLLGDE